MIHPQHFEEIAASGVRPDIIRANFESLHGNSAIEFVAGDQLDSLGGESHQWATAAVRKTLRLYAHVEDGGWACTGLDPLNDWERMSWGQLKPDSPRPDPNDASKTIKYEGQYKVDARATLLEDPSHPGFWSEVQQNTSTPIYIGEGAKKAGLLLSLGYGAIALPGVWMGRRKDPERLIPELEVFAQPGREFIFVFDADQKRKTRKAVAAAIQATAQLLEAQGCTIKVVRWLPSLGKGIDDVWANHGADKVHELLAAAAPLKDQQQLAELRQQEWQQHKEKQRQIWLAQREAQARAHWQRLRTFTPTQTVEQRYVSVEAEILRGADIHALKSDMGTGKTHELARILSGLDMGAIAIGSRNSLLLQSCERWGGFYHLQQDSAHGLTADPYSRIATCIDSLTHFQPQHFDGKIIILDEVMSVIKHGLMSTTLKHRRSDCLDKLKEAIKRAALVIAWDGNNADIAINYLAALRGPDCRVIKQLNKFKGDRLRVELVQSVNEDGAALLRDRSPVERKLKDALEAARYLPTDAARAAIAISDSQRQCEALDNKHSEAGYQVLRVDSKTITDKAVREFLKAPDEYLRENPIDLLIMSPTAESGIDISIKGYFAHGYAFFCGVIDTDTQMQFLRRARACLDWSIWCQEYTLIEEWEGTRSPFARRLQSQLLDYLQMDAIASLEGDERAALLERFLKQLKEETDNPHTQATLKLMAARNFERSHTRECLEHALTEAGHHATQIELSKDESVSDAMAAARREVIETDASAIFHARDISLTEALSIKASFGANLDDRYAAEKALLIARLPGIQRSEVWSVDLVKRLLFTERQLLPQTERYWMLRHMEAAKERSRQAWAALVGEKRLFLPDIRSDFAKLKALESLGLLDILDKGEAITGQSEVAQKLHKRCKRSKCLQTALGKAPGKLSPMDWLGRLMASLGVSRVKRMSRRDKNRDRYGIYTYIAPEVDKTRSALLSCLDQRFEKYVLIDRAVMPDNADDSLVTLPREKNIDPAKEDPLKSPCSSKFYSGTGSSLFKIDDWLLALIDVQAMIAEAGGDLGTLAYLREAIPPDLWAAALSSG